MSKSRKKTNSQTRRFAEKSNFGFKGAVLRGTPFVVRVRQGRIVFQRADDNGKAMRGSYSTRTPMAIEIEEAERQYRAGINKALRLLGPKPDDRQKGVKVRQSKAAEVSRKANVLAEQGKLAHVIAKAVGRSRRQVQRILKKDDMTGSE